MILCYYQLNDSFFFQSFRVLRGFSCKKYMCNALRLDDMDASLLDYKYGSPLFDVPSS
jgi:hypothetical protein